MSERQDMHTDSAVITAFVAIVDIVLDDSKGSRWHCVQRWLGKDLVRRGFDAPLLRFTKFQSSAR